MKILLSAKVLKKKSKYNCNFPSDFLIDFDLAVSEETDKFPFFWVLSKKAERLFHSPGTFHDLDGNEGPNHYRYKQNVHDYIYEQYYMENECKFYVTTELQQKKNPFKARTDGKEKVFYKLDICVVREKDFQVFDIEIDGIDHIKSQEKQLKDRIRDELLKFRYGIYTLRLDSDWPINYKHIDEFLNLEAMEYTRTRVKDGKKTVRKDYAKKFIDYNNM